MNAPATLASQTSKREDLASWENEGGAPRASRDQSGQPALPPEERVDRERAQGASHGADTGLTDTHTLAVMRFSFLLLIPVFTVMVVFWAAIAMRGSG